MQDIRSLRYEDRAAANAAAVVPRRDAVTADIGLDAVEHGDEAIRLTFGSAGFPIAYAASVSGARQVGHDAISSGLRKCMRRPSTTFVLSGVSRPSTRSPKPTTLPASLFFFPPSRWIGRVSMRVKP